MSWEPLSMTAPSRAWTSSGTFSPPPPATSTMCINGWSGGQPRRAWKVTITNLTAGLASMNLAGPLARSVCTANRLRSLFTAAFPYMEWRQATVAGVPATMMRIGFVGEMGWEIMVAADLEVIFGSRSCTPACCGRPAPFRRGSATRPSPGKKAHHRRRRYRCAQQSL